MSKVNSRTKGSFVQYILSKFIHKTKPSPRQRAGILQPHKNIYMYIKPTVSQRSNKFEDRDTILLLRYV